MQTDGTALPVWQWFARPPDHLPVWPPHARLAGNGMLLRNLQFEYVFYYDIK
jgi:hypothetical protein